MTTCPQCGTQNLPGMAYCEHCGAPLAQEQAPEGAQLDPVASAASAQAQAILDSLNAAQEAAPASAQAPEEQQPAEPADAAAPPVAAEAAPEAAPEAEAAPIGAPTDTPSPADGGSATLTLGFPNGATFTVATEVTNVGRSDVAQGWHPELDVIPYGGGSPDLGVSRHQARIQAENGGFVMVDVGSTNGTFVNGKALAYNTPVGLQDGDAIAFGAFNVSVSIK
jgi:hypothetical protein